MDRDRALDRLSGMYGRALRLAETGHSPAQIAAQLGIDEAAVAPLLQIGARKLERLLGGGADGGEPAGDWAGGGGATVTEVQ